MAFYLMLNDDFMNGNNDFCFLFVRDFRFSLNVVDNSFLYRPDYSIDASTLNEFNF